jgi:hypothetical protein
MSFRPYYRDGASLTNLRSRAPWRTEAFILVAAIYLGLEGKASEERMNYARAGKLR